MQKPKVLTVTCLILTVVAIGADHAVSRLPLPMSRRLPIEAFPRTIGTWHAGPDEAVDAALHDRLPSARIVQRSYSNALGQSIELVLVTASNSEDFHDPTSCLPAQGWNLGHRTQRRIGGQAVQTMVAEQDGAKVDVIYWLGGYPERPKLPTAFLRRVYALREKIGQKKGASLFVRLITPDPARNDQTLTAFTAQIMPSVQALTAPAPARTTSSNTNL